MSQKIKWPLILIVGVLIFSTMLRLGFWQLERAEQKQNLLDAKITQSSQPPTNLVELIEPLDDIKAGIEVKALKIDNRFRRVRARGHYLVDKSIYIDNQVVDGQVGYRVVTPLQLAPQSDTLVVPLTILVNRGWIGVGDSRAQLPLFNTDSGELILTGRLNTPPSQPPLWNDNYAVAQGAVWAYLPIAEYAAQMGLSVLPLVIELAPDSAPDSQFKRRLADISDEWVAKHHGYAFQWFAMTVAFFIASVVLTVRKFKK